MTQKRRNRGVLVALAGVLTALPLAAQQAVRSDLIDAPQLLLDLKTLSADDMEGRAPGTPGGDKARAYILDRFRALGLDPGTQEFTFSSRRGGAPAEVKGLNILAGVKGTRTPGRYIVITAHYDHVGVRNGTVFNGADDNASGTAALFALAKYFSAKKPANSLMFLALDAEESGLRGARAFVADPPAPLESLVINLNMDMIGRDPSDLLYVVGTRQQPFLKPFIERIAAKAPVKLVMGHDDPTQKEDWTSQSDHKAFCDAKIPCLYFGVEDFDQHHRATDDYETMTHAFYVRAVETMVRAIEEFDARLDEVIKARGGKGRPRP
jgi:hypothetical protein